MFPSEIAFDFDNRSIDKRNTDGFVGAIEKWLVVKIQNFLNCTKPYSLDFLNNSFSIAEDFFWIGLTLEKENILC